MQNSNSLLLLIKNIYIQNIKNDLEHERLTNNDESLT